MSYLLQMIDGPARFQHGQELFDEVAGNSHCKWPNSNQHLRIRQSAWTRKPYTVHHHEYYSNCYNNH